MLRALSKRKKKILIRPEDNGKRMSLDDFEFAEVQEGYRYELGNGVIEVSNVPRLSHGKMVEALYGQLLLYKVKNPEVLKYLSASNNAKLLIGSRASERHPDLFVYCTDAPEDANPWPSWVPDIVVEVVSESSRKRDYEVKPQEYLDLGIDEYWIVDPSKKQMTANVRYRGLWKAQVVKASQKYSSPRLPGFTLDLKKVFAAAK